MPDSDTIKKTCGYGTKLGRYIPASLLVIIGFILVLASSESKTKYSLSASDVVGVAHADAPIPEAPILDPGSCGGDGGGDCGGDCGGGGDGGGDCP